MPNFVGQQCTSCRDILTEQDNIVVCPECGSPYHKECYIKEGKCVNSALHESKKSWQPQTVLASQDGQDSAEHTMVKCKNCGTENDSENAFCTQCGAPVNMEKAAGTIYQRIKQDDEADSRRFGGMPFLDFSPIDNETDVDGNTVGEYIKYTGRSFYYFIPKFLRFSKKSSVSMNFSAMLFPEFYFFYRKMIPEGIAALAATIILSIPTAINMVYASGMVGTASILNQAWFVNLCNVSAMLYYIVRILCGLFANWFYYKKAKKDLDEIKSKVLEEGSRSSAIAAAGGTSWQNVIIAFVIQLIANAAIIFAVTYFALAVK